MTEGDRVEVRLRAEAFGIYANPIQIGVICAPTRVTGVPAGRETFPGSDTSIIYNIIKCQLDHFEFGIGIMKGKY